MVKNNFVYIDTGFVEHNTYKKISVDHSLTNDLQLIQCNNKNGDIIYNGELIFDGTNGYLLNKLGYINFNEGQLYIECDFSPTSKVGDANGFQTIFSIFPLENINDYNIALYISPAYNFISLCQYNTGAGLFASHYITHKLELNETYNIKIFRSNSNNSLCIFINNIMKYKTKSFTSNNMPSGQNAGQINNDYTKKYLRIGQQHVSALNHNFKGKISNFRIIKYIGSFDELPFESFSDKLEYHLLLEGYTNFSGNDNNLYKNLQTSNLGKNSKNATITALTISQKPYTNLNDGELFWYTPKPTGISNPRAIKFTQNPLRYSDKCTITFRMKTNAVLSGCVIFDCRSAAGQINGLFMSLADDDPSKIKLYISNINNTSTWQQEYFSDARVLEPNTYYFVRIIKDNNNIKIILNKKEVLNVNISGTINWLTNDVLFFNNSASSSACPHYVKDLRVYTDIITEMPELDSSKIINLNYRDTNNVIEYISEYNKIFKNISNDSVKTPYNYKGNTYEFDKQQKFVSTIENIIYRKYYIFAEGHPEYRVDLYKHNKLILENINNTSINITEDRKYEYFYEIKELGIKKNITKTMILGSLEINVNKISCEGSDLYIRLYRSDNGAFIGEYEFVNNKVIIPNLEYTTLYDVQLIDRNKVLETIVKSRLKPKFMHIDSNINRESFLKIRELSKYEASLIFENSILNSIQNNQSLYSVYLQNTNKSISKFKILNYIGNLYDVLGTIDNKEILRLKNTINDNTKTINIDGKISNRIVKNSLIEIDNETMFVLNVNNNEITVNRGILFSLPNKHYTGSIIKILSECYFIEKPAAESYINYINVDENNIESTINSEKIIYTKSNNKLKSECFPGNIQINGNKINDSIKLIDDFILSWNYKEDTDDWFDIKNTPSNITYDIEIISADNSSIYYENVKSPLIISETDITSYKTKLRLITCKNGIKSPFAFSIELESQPGLLNFTLDNNNLIPNLTYQNNIIMED